MINNARNCSLLINKTVNSCSRFHLYSCNQPRSPSAAFLLQNLVEKITRNKIYASVYWKKDCFGLSAETLVDKAVELKYIGGMIGEPQKPTEFICLILKMLQIQPDKEIIIEFIKNDDYKYVRLLGG